MSIQSEEDRKRLGQRIGIAIVLGALITGSWVWHINIEDPRTNDAMVRANIVDVVLQHVNGRNQRTIVASR